MNQNVWDERYVRLSEEVASWSRDPSTKVGAVIVDGHGRPVSFGYNGFPRGADDSLMANREEKYRRVIHAEMNAILAAGKDLSGCTIFVSHNPCLGCLGAMRQSFITRIVCRTPTPEFASRWNPEESISYAKELGITLEFI